MSNLRNLAPSNQRAFNSSDSSMSKAGSGNSKDPSIRTTSAETIDSGGNGRDEEDEKRGGTQEERVRERRPPGTVAGRACNECRQARQKVSKLS